MIALMTQVLMKLTAMMVGHNPGRGACLTMVRMVTPKESKCNAGIAGSGAILQFSARLRSNRRKEMIKCSWLKKVSQKRI